MAQIAAGVMAIIVIYAWIDGGETDLQDVTVPVALSGSGSGEAR